MYYSLVKCNVFSFFMNYCVREEGTEPNSRSAISNFNVLQQCYNLTLYVPCIILQYVYEPTRCTPIQLAVLGL